MSSKKQIQVNMSFNADTASAKRSLDELQRQLSTLINQPVPIGEKMTSEIQQATRAAAELKVHLQNATNVKTGNLDLSKLHRSLQQSKFELADYGAQLQKMGPQGQKAFMQLANSIARAEIPMKRTSALMKEIKQTFANTIQWQLSSSAIHGVMGAIQGAYSYSQKLNESLNNIRIVTNKSVEDMSRFAAEANKAAKALSASTIDYTDASLIYYQQGLTDEQVRQRADVTIKMANVSRQSAEIVSDQMTAIWNNFYDGSKSLEYYADVVTALGAATASSSEEISQGLEKFAAVAETVGLSYEYATAALATVTSTTRQSADVVGTAFKTLFARIQDLNLGKTLDDGTTLGKYSEALNKVGINIKDANGDLKDMDTVLEEMGAKWKTLSKDNQVALAKSVAGIRQYTQLIALMDNWDFMQKNLSTAETAAGTLTDQAEIYAESWEAAQKRVKANAEKLYSTLINDEFFIDLTDTFADLINLVGQFTQSIGGLSGILMGAGMILSRIYGKEMAQGFRDLAFRIVSTSETGRKATMSWRATALQNMADQITFVEEVTAGYQQAQNVYKGELELQSKMLEKEQLLTEEEKQQNNYLLEQYRTMGAIAVQQAEQLGDLRDQSFDLGFSLQDDGLDETEVQYLKDQGKNAGKIISEAMHIANKKLTDGSFDARKSIDEIKNAFAELGTDFNNEQIASFFENLEGDAKQAETAVKSLEQILNEKLGHVAELSAGASGLDKQSNEYKALVAEIKKYLVLSQKIETTERQIGASRKNLETITEELKKALDNAGISVKDWAHNLSSAVQGISSLGMTISSIKGLMDTIKDPGTSNWEKFAMILTSISMIASSIGGTITGMKDAWKLIKDITNKQTIEQLKKIATEIIEERVLKKTAQAQREKNQAVDQGTKETREYNNEQTKKVVLDGIDGTQDNPGQGKLPKGKMPKIDGKAFGKAFAGKGGGGLGLLKGGGMSAGMSSLGSFVAGVAAIASAVAIVAGAITLAVAEYNKFEKAAERAQESAKAAAESYNEIKTKYDEFKSSVNDYKDITNSMKDMTKGTVEYREAILKANEAAMKLIENYKGLKYEIDNEGVIQIDEQSLENIQQQQLNQLGRAQASSISASMQANRRQATADRRDLARDIDTRQDNWMDAGNTIAMTFAGALAGLLFGGGVGAIIGGAAGLIGGGIATGIVGSGTKAEDDALLAIAEYYRKNGNSMFADDKEFERVLREEIKVSENLIDGLVNNREAIEELTKVEAARLTKESAEWKNMFGAYNTGTAAYDNAENKAYLANVAEKDKVKYEEDANEYIGSLMSGWNDSKLFEEYIKKVLGDENLEHYQVKDRWGANATLWKDGQKVTNDDSLNKEDVKAQLKELYILEQVSKEIGVNVETYKDQLEDLSDIVVDIEDEKSRALVDDIIAQYANGKGGPIDLSKYNYDEVMQIAVDNIADAEMRASVEKAKENYINGMSDLHKKIIKEPWYKELSQEQRTLLWSITISENATMEEVQNAYRAAQEFFDANQINATIDIGFGLQSLLKAEKKDWTKIKAEYGNWQADKNNTLPWEKFLALSEQEQIDYLNSYNTAMSTSGIIVANNAVKSTEQAGIDATNQLARAENAIKYATNDNEYRKWNNEIKRQGTTNNLIAVAKDVGTYEDGRHKWSDRLNLYANNNIQPNQHLDMGNGSAKTVTLDRLLAFVQGGQYHDYISQMALNTFDEMVKYAENLQQNKDFITGSDEYAYLQGLAETFISQMGIDISSEEGKRAITGITRLFAHRDSMNNNAQNEAGSLDTFFEVIYDAYESNVLIPAQNEQQREDDAIVAAYGSDKLKNEIGGIEGNAASAINNYHSALQARHDSIDSWEKYIKTLGLSLDEIYKVRDALQQLYPQLAKNDALTNVISASMLRYKNALSQVQSNYQTWMDGLQSDNILDKTNAISGLTEAYGNFANIDGSKLSTNFLQSLSNLTLMQQAMSGDKEAFAQLQALIATDLYGKSTVKGQDVSAIMSELANDDSNPGDVFSVSGNLGSKIKDLYLEAYNDAINNQKLSEFEAQTQANAIINALGFDLNSADISSTGQVKDIYSFVKITKEMPDIMDLLNEEAKATGKTLDEVLERYYEINNQLDDMTDAIDDANRELDKMYGKARISQMEKVNNLLTKEIGLLEEKADWNTEYAAFDKTRLDNQLKLRDFELKDSDGNIIDGFTYDEKDNITNFTQVMDAIIAKSDTIYKDLNELTSAESRADYEKKTLQPFTEWMEKVIEYAKTYKETIEEGEDIQNEIADAWSEWQTRNSEILNLKLELKISINDRELEYIENKINNMSDDFYQMAEVAGLLKSKADVLNNNTLANAYVELEHARKAVNEKGDAWLTDADYYASLEELLSQVYSNIDAIKQLDDTMMSYYGDTLAAAGEELAKFTTQMEHQSSVLDHYKSIMTAIGKEVDYKSMGVILKGQSELLGDQYGVAKQNYEMLAGEAAKKYKAWQDALKDNKDAEAELYKAEYEAALQASNEAQNKYLELANKWAEALKAELENTLADLDKTLEEALTGGTTFDRLNTTMERTRSLQEEYLTTTNKVYETNKLMRQAQQEIDKISNTSAKRRLQAYIQETQQLQGQSKLSQYELEIQRAKYDLLLAEIALEEAQNAKSTVRLQRDSEGNFGYVYTADQNAIDDASQKLADAQNSLYNLGLQGANEYTEKIIQLNSEMYDKLVELHKAKADGEFKTEEEYQEAVTELQNYWNEQRMNYSNLYSVALTTDSAVVADAWSTDVQYMIDASADWSTKVNEYVAGVTGAFADWEKKVATIASDTTGKDLGTLATKVEEVTNKSKDLVDILSGIDGKDGLLKLMQTELDKVTKKTDAYAKLRDELQKTAEAYNGLAGKMKDALGEANGSNSGENTDEATWYTYTDENGKETGHYSSAEEAAKAAWEAKHLKGTMSAEDVNNLGITLHTVQDGKNVVKTFGDIVGNYSKDWKTRVETETGTGENVEAPGPSVLPDSGSTNAPPAPETPEGPGTSGAVTLPKYKSYAYKHFGQLSSVPYPSAKMAAQNAIYPSDEIGYMEHDMLTHWSKGTWHSLGIAKKYLGTSSVGSPTIIGPSITPPGDIGMLPIQPPGIIPFASGGYTGAWGSYGKLAMLHEKELVLNKNQTQDFLLSMEVLERILQTIDLQSINSQIGGILSSPGFSNPGNGILEQNVHIEASFPNATNHSEIEEAFGNLVNLASQYANRK